MNIDNVTITTTNFDALINEDFNVRLASYSLDYTNEIDPIDLEEAVRDYKNGNTEAFIEIHRQSVKILAKATHRLVDEDMSQALAEILLERILPSFDENCGTKFSTYFWQCAKKIPGQIKRFNSAQKRGGNTNYKNPRLVELRTRERNGEYLTPDEYRELLCLEAETRNVANISLHATYDTNDSSVEMEAFIADKSQLECYDDASFDVDLSALEGLIKPKEMKALMMIARGAKLREIVDEVEGFNSPAAVTQALHRLGAKKGIGKLLRQLLVS